MVQYLHFRILEFPLIFWDPIFFPNWEFLSGKTSGDVSITEKKSLTNTLPLKIPVSIDDLPCIKWGVSSSQTVSLPEATHLLFFIFFGGTLRIIPLRTLTHTNPRSVPLIRGMILSAMGRINGKYTAECKTPLGLRHVYYLSWKLSDEDSRPPPDW